MKKNRRQSVKKFGATLANKNSQVPTGGASATAIKTPKKDTPQDQKPNNQSRRKLIEPLKRTEREIPKIDSIYLKYAVEHYDEFYRGKIRELLESVRFLEALITLKKESGPS